MSTTVATKKPRARRVAKPKRGEKEISPFGGAAVKKDQLDAIAEGDPHRVIALMLWKWRHHNPAMSMEITEADISKLEASCDYLGIPGKSVITPGVLIKRPQGRPAQPEIAGVGNRPGRSAVPAELPRPFVVVALVNEGTEDALRPVENNEGDAKLADEAREVQAAIYRARSLSGDMMAQLAEGAYSSSTIREAAETLTTLAKALQ